MVCRDEELNMPTSGSGNGSNGWVYGGGHMGVE